MFIRNSNNSAGQSTIEFIFVFMFGLSLIFMVMNSAINYCTGYLVHYATFMASRAYLTQDSYTGTVSSAGGSMDLGADHARSVFSRYMLQAFGVQSNQFDINPVPPNHDDFSSANYLAVGGRTLFELKADVIGKILGQSKLELVSESFLGHEPTRAICGKGACLGITGSANCSSEAEMDITLYDDGC